MFRTNSHKTHSMNILSIEYALHQECDSQTFYWRTHSQGYIRVYKKICNLLLNCQLITYLCQFICLFSKAENFIYLFINFPEILLHSSSVLQLNASVAIRKTCFTNANRVNIHYIMSARIFALK